MFTVAILTLSDKGSRGEREDKSGPVIAEMLDADLYEVVHTAILPDEKHIIESNLKALCDAIDPGMDTKKKGQAETLACP